MKYNWGNTDEKRVLINLSHDEKHLHYQSVDRISKWSLMKGPTKIPMDSFTGILYGGTSTTFQKRKKAMIARARRRRKYEYELLA